MTVPLVAFALSAEIGKHAESLTAATHPATLPVSTVEIVYVPGVVGAAAGVVLAFTSSIKTIVAFARSTRFSSSVQRPGDVDMKIDASVVPLLEVPTAETASIIVKVRPWMVPLIESLGPPELFAPHAHNAIATARNLIGQRYLNRTHLATIIGRGRFARDYVPTAVDVD